jgi:ankyrin repeat domain-containing protein 50
MQYQIGFETGPNTSFVERKLELEVQLKRKIKTWLCPPKKNIDWESDLEFHSKAVEGTCLWLPEHPHYQAWRLSQASEFAWLHGIQGCGKLTLVSFLVKNFQLEGVKMAYFFCGEGASLPAAFRISCLVHQMVSQDDSVFQALIPSYERTTCASVTTLLTAKTIFKHALKAFGNCFILIDALDECSDRVELIKALLDVIQEIPSGLKIFCSSRNEPDIESLLQGHSQVVDIPVSPASIRSDIAEVIADAMAKSVDLSEKLKRYPETRRCIIENLNHGAQGMFLLPKLMIEDLATKSTLEEFYEFLGDLPVDLRPYYMRILERMDQRWRPMAKRVFTWVASARRPLSLAELNEALCIDGDQYLSLELDIKSACGCLVTIEKEQVRLINNSVKRFLLDSEIFGQSPLYSCLFTPHPDEYLADVCTRYLFKGEYSRPAMPNQRFQFKNPNALREPVHFSTTHLFIGSVTAKHV